MFDVLVKLKWFFKKYWKQYTMAIVLLIFTSILEVIPPMYIGEAIDSITTGTMNSKKLWGILIPFFIILVNYSLSATWQYQLYGGAIKLEKTLRSRLMYHFLKMTPTFYEKNRTGDLMARATNDLNAVSLTAGYGIMTLIDSTIYLGAIIVAMGMFTSWKLTILAMIPVPIMAFFIQYFGNIVHRRYSVAQSTFGKLNNRVLESVAGVRVVRAYVQELKEEERFNQMSEEVYEKYMNVVKVEALFGPLTRLGTVFCYCIALGFGAILINQNELTLGGLVSFTVYLGLAVWPMMAIGELINVMQQGNASLDRVQETLRQKEDVKTGGEKNENALPSSIGFSDFTFQYPLSHVKNLKQISVQLKKGETLGIVGKTGSGKTTFVKQLLREYPLGEGQFKISDIDVSKIPKSQVLSWIGYVPQDHFLFSKTIEENILYGKEDATKEELEEVIKLAYLEKDIEMLPHGLSTLVGEKGVSLSGGQKQRVSIARALIKNPEILILDDALSAVDAKTEAKIIENIRNVRKGKTTIITTHRLSAIQHADYIIVLDDGKIVEEGTHKQLIEKNGWYKEQYVRQQLGEAEKESE